MNIIGSGGRRQIPTGNVKIFYLSGANISRCKYRRKKEHTKYIVPQFLSSYGPKIFLAQSAIINQELIQPVLTLSSSNQQLHMIGAEQVSKEINPCLALPRQQPAINLILATQLTAHISLHCPDLLR